MMLPESIIKALKIGWQQPPLIKVALQAENVNGFVNSTYQLL